MMKRTILSLVALAFLALPPPAFAVDISLDGNLRANCGTATASGGAATLANKCGVVTSEALTTAAGSGYTLTLTNTVAAAADIVVASVDNGTNTTGDLTLERISPTAGQIVFIVKNTSDLPGGLVGSKLAWTGSIKVRYMVIKP